jgi:hypothetical protein
VNKRKEIVRSSLYLFSVLFEGGKKKLSGRGFKITHVEHESFKTVRSRLEQAERGLRVVKYEIFLRTWQRQLARPQDPKLKGSV